MPQSVFINLAVADVAKATAFYEAIGATRNPMFSNEQASSMVWSDTVYTMLLHRDFFQTFTNKEIADAHRVVESLTCLTRDSRAAVDEMAARAVAAGGKETRPPQDHGFMYGRAFEDLDGHIIECVWMDPNGTPG
jgi:predicted lactoylglutathione lyase